MEKIKQIYSDIKKISGSLSKQDIIALVDEMYDEGDVVYRCERSTGIPESRKEEYETSKRRMQEIEKIFQGYGWMDEEGCWTGKEPKWLAKHTEKYQ